MIFLADGDTRLAKLDQLRAKRAELVDRIETAAAALLPLDVAVANLMHRVRQRIELGLLSIMQFNKPGVHDYMAGSDLGALTAMVGEDVIEANVRKLLSTETGERRSLQDRDAEIRKCRAEVDKIERAEELEVLRLEAQGFSVHRREDVDMALILAIWEETL